jgi:hypothetical protein
MIAAQMDLFAPIPPARTDRAVITQEPAAQRRLCPFVCKGLPTGGTGDLATLIVDGIRGTETVVD